VHEKQGLPFDELIDTGNTWSLAAALPAERPNAVRIRRRLRSVLDVARGGASRATRVGTRLAAERLSDPHP
jgi:hypothetical protein